jgi:hypothetical protein
MAITIDGAGTITGLAVGGLPDGVVDGDMLASGVGGKCLQILQAQNTDITTISSTTWADISGMSQAITLTSGSKVLLTFSGAGSGSNGIYLRFDRGGTTIGVATNVSSREPTTFGTSDGVTNQNAESITTTWLDTHGTSGAVTYKVQWRGQGTSPKYFGRQKTDTDSDSYPRTVTTFTVMEIGA